MNVDIPHPSPPSGEQANIPEFLGQDNIGLQARFLEGDLTNPKLVVTKKTFRPIEKNGARGINQEAVGTYQGASITQRRRHQQETGLTLDKWREGFDTYLGEVRKDTTHAERKEFLETVGITATVTADDFYKEYLQGRSEVTRFVDEVETQATSEQIQKNQDIIRNLGNAFGYESSEVIEHLIHGVRNVKSDIDGFVKEAKRAVNSPEVLDNPLLQKIQEDSDEEKKREPVVQEVAVLPAKTVPKEPEPPGTQSVSKPPRPHYAASPVKKVDLDKEPEPPAKKTAPEKAAPSRGPSLPARLELKPSKKGVQTQIFPAPDSQPGRMDTPLSDDELHEALSYLLFNDVLPHKTEDQAALLRESEKVRYYARELHTLMQDYGSDVVLERAVMAVLVLNRDLMHFGFKSDKHTKSQSWYLRGVAKSRFLANNPDIQATLQNADKYDPFDPLLHIKEGSHSVVGKRSQKAEEEIIEGMLGWEIYRQRKKVDDIIFRLDPLIAPRDKDRLRELLGTSPKDDTHTLSTYQLQEIGHVVRNNIPRQ